MMLFNKSYTYCLDRLENEKTTGREKERQKQREREREKQRPCVTQEMFPP